MLSRLLLWLTSFVALTSAGVRAANQPNILFILGDNWKWPTAGILGDPMAKTPAFDRVAREGVLFTHTFNPVPSCSPTRSCLLTGKIAHQLGERASLWSAFPKDTPIVTDLLREAGYATGVIGKWGVHGLNLEPNAPAHPLKRGFDYYYGYLRHVDGHEHYPKEMLYFAEKAAQRGPIKVWENYQDSTEPLDKCYTTDLFTARAKKWITEQAGAAVKKPFFLYLAHDTPHAVLELPTQAYPAGGGLKGGMQWIGTPGHMISTASGTPDSWIHPDYAGATYDDDRNAATPEKPWPDVYKRYATSVRRLDDSVGDLIKLLQDLKLDDNTLVIFASDNGPSIESYLTQAITPEFFASFGPFDGIKRDLWEGGLRTPAIARWPRHIPAGRVIETPSAMWDWLPTFAQVAGLPAPARADGISLLPALTGTGKPTPRDYLYWEYNLRT
jgi:arylsulfatase A-like enzyme